MSLVAFDGTPLIPIGQAGRQGSAALPTATNTILDAASESAQCIGQIFWTDGGSHTVDTSGSSSLGWRTSTSTFANAGSTLKVGLAAVLATAGPPARAANAADVITFSVSKTLTGGGGGVASATWNEHVPDAGTLTLAHGDLTAFCVQMTARAGADSVPMQNGANVVSNARPGVTSFTGGSYAAASAVPNVVITASDGTKGFIFGGCVFQTPTTTQTWNSGSATKEYGNFLQMPVPAKIYGILVSCDFAADADVVLYSDPLGTPVAEKTVAVDANTVAASAVVSYGAILFPSPYSSTANQPLAAIIKPGGSNVGLPYTTLNASAHQAAYALGTNGYAINRASGAFAAQNSSKDRFAIGLLVGAFDAGGSSGRAIQVNNPSLVS